MKGGLAVTDVKKRNNTGNILALVRESGSLSLSEYHVIVVVKPLIFKVYFARYSYLPHTETQHHIAKQLADIV